LPEKILPYDRAIVGQETGWWCGPASTQVVLNSRGIVIAEATLAAEIGTHRGGTDHIGLIERVLDVRVPEARYTSVQMPNDPPTAAQREQLWRHLVQSIDAGWGVVMNWVAPPSNRPRGVRGSVSPNYPASRTTYHYVAAMGYYDGDGDPAARAVWIADSGFQPQGYWVSLEQCATLIPPKGYCYADTTAAAMASAPVRIYLGRNYESTGDRVRTLQQRLNQEPYISIAVDGVFGPATEAAVREYQRRNGLAVDGVAGPATLARLGLDLAPAAPAPADGTAVELLAHLMGNALPLERYRQLLPAVSLALRACGCTNTRRIAMWVAQIGHESGGLKWMEELSDGRQYEGRADLGNTQPGDGPRYKGRGPIQITGRHNYTQLSSWAHAQGLVPTPTFFVDQPEQLASDQYGFTGVIWYWTVARPQINSLADAEDLQGVTRAINGGLNGLEDRQQRWSRARAAGDRLLTLIEEEDPLSALSPAEQRELLELLRWLAAPGTGELRKRFPSRSPFRPLDQGQVDTLAGMELFTNAATDFLLIEKLAVDYGDVDTVARLLQVAQAVDDPQRWGDRERDARWAAMILERVPQDALVRARQKLGIEGRD